MSINPICPKCSQKMTGPVFEKSLYNWDECLRWRCSCGYSMTTPCDDARKSALDKLQELGQEWEQYDGTCEVCGAALKDGCCTGKKPDYSTWWSRGGRCP